MLRYRWLGWVGGIALAALVGCSDSKVAVKGVVKVDGNAVEGAVVTFVSEDGKETFTGTSGPSGEFTLSGTEGKAGAKPGTYKVTVVKTSARGEPMTPENMQQAQKEMQAASKGGKQVGGGPGMPMAPMGPGGMMGGGMMGGMGQAPGIKTELPVVYASAETTPIKVTLPSAGPVVIELKSK